MKFSSVFQPIHCDSRIFSSSCQPAFLWPCLLGDSLPKDLSKMILPSYRSVTISTAVSLNSSLAEIYFMSFCPQQIAHSRYLSHAFEPKNKKQKKQSPLNKTSINICACINRANFVLSLWTWPNGQLVPHQGSVLLVSVLSKYTSSSSITVHTIDFPECFSHELWHLPLAVLDWYVLG